MGCEAYLLFLAVSGWGVVGADLFDEMNPTKLRQLSTPYFKRQRLGQALFDSA